MSSYYDIWMRNAPVWLRWTGTGLALVCRRQRRWWQFWYPKTRLVTLAFSSCQIQSGDRMELRKTKSGYAGIVNDWIVVQWPSRVRESH